MLKQVRFCDFPDCPGMTEQKCVACERDVCEQHRHLLSILNLSVCQTAVLSRSGVVCVDCHSALQTYRKNVGDDPITITKEMVDRWEQEAIIWIKAAATEKALGESGSLADRMRRKKQGP
jgi:hypothetical protein